MDLSNLWPWSFTFYVCVESLFDRLVVGGQIESFRIKSTPKMFGCRCNCLIWTWCLGKEQFHLDPKLLRQSSGNRCFLTIPFILWDFSWPCGGCAGTDSSVLPFPLGISGVHSSSSPPSWQNRRMLAQSLSSPRVWLVSSRVLLCLPFSQESIFIVAVTVPAISQYVRGHRVSVQFA